MTILERSKRGAAPLLCFIILISSAMTAKSAVISDNLTNNQDGLNFFSPTTWRAQSFSTTGADFRLTRVQINAFYSGLTAGTFSLDVYDATGSGTTPGTFVANVASNVDYTNLTTSLSNIYDANNLNILLNPSTKYFLVVKAGTMTGGSFIWGTTANNTQVVGFPSEHSDSTNSGSSWGPASLANPQIMKINAVPEPSTYAMGAIASVVLAGFARRKNRTA